MINYHLEGDFHNQGNRLMVMLYVANHTGHDPLWFTSSHNQVKIKALVLLWIHQTQINQSIKQ